MTLVSIDRTSLSLGSLDIGTIPGAAYWLPEDGITEPDFDQRQTFADDSPDVAGSLLVQSVPAIGSLALKVYTTAADADTLKAQKRALEAAVGQFSYSVTLTLVGAPDTYNALPGKVSWGQLDSGQVASLIAVAAVTIPLQPLGG